MRILHVLDHGLPLQSGYTFRTRAILKAQEARGWTVAAVTGPRHTPGGAAVEVVDGLTFHRTARRRGGIVGEAAGRRQCVHALRPDDVGNRPGGQRFFEQRNLSAHVSSFVRIVMGPRPDVKPTPERSREFG